MYINEALIYRNLLKILSKKILTKAICIWMYTCIYK